MRKLNLSLLVCGSLLAAVCCAGREVWAEDAAAQPAEDPYVTYIKTSKDFKPVKQDKDWAYKAYPSWVYMPWYYQWSIGFNDEGGQFSVDNGYNGAFVDHGDAKHLDWIDKYKLKFYMDHSAGKGFLHLWDGDKVPGHKKDYTGTGMRPFLLNKAGLAKLEGLLKERIGNVKSSPNRAAYALDDEVSWGVFSKPCMWQVTDDRGAYSRWLEEVYGKDLKPNYKGWIGYNDIRKDVDGWSLKQFDAGQLIDQWTFNDSTWANFLGDLVEYANTVDPATPCGFVGGQAPGPFGYDYAKIMKKIQYLEAYNYGSSQAVIRSFNPHNALPTVTTHFHNNSRDDQWQFYYYVAHGNRGHIGWVENWFDGNKPKAWQAEIAPALRECGQKLGPLQAGSEWIHDGVAIYYSQASIQLGWIMGATTHGGTWINRDSDAGLGGPPLVRQAWVNMLREEGIQFNFIAYDEVVRNGIPKEYKVLILPATMALSDAEAARIKEFCKAGGTVIADYLPGCFDQHGRGRKTGGVLDDMFGVKHSPDLKGDEVFQGKGWWEVNEDDHYSDKSAEKHLSDNACIKDESGFNKVVRDMAVNRSAKFGNGTAVLMNLSPQWYNAYREKGMDLAKKRSIFTQHVAAAGVKPWVRIDGADARTFGYEITYWQKEDRVLVFLVSNPATTGGDLGGGNSVGLKTDTIEVTLKFAQPVKAVKNERTDEDLGDGSSFKLKWKMNEAAVLSLGR